MRPPFPSRPNGPPRRGLLRCRDGSAAVEFGMLALPFCLMVFAVLELAMIFVVDSVLENAAISTGRLVRTGQASAQGMTAATFKTTLCARMSIFSADCPGRVSIDVRVIPKFDVTPPDPVVAGVVNPAALTYANGNPGDLVLVRVWYRQPLLTPMLWQAAPPAGTGEALLMAVTAFRNEPA